MEIDEGELVSRHTVLRAVVGPTACGLAGNEDEPDRRGVYVAPTDAFWRFSKPPTRVAGPELDLVSWEVEPFCAAGLRADPEVFEVLSSPLVESCTTIGDELRDLTPAFLSQRAADAYRRATAAEFARADAAMASGGTPRWPQVAEVIRLLLCCEELLRTGQLAEDLSQHREPLLAVRAGEMPWPEAVAWVESLRDRSAEAVLRSPLPAVPNLDAVQYWLMSVRRRQLTD